MKPQQSPPEAHPEIEIVRLVWLAIFVSVFSFLFYYRHEEILLYGDAVAHINIARRVFDSKTPGLLQLGTVWLPLPHLLIIPFIVSKHLWQTGAGGSIPSMAAFVLGVLGIFRLVRGMVSRNREVNAIAKVVSWASSIVYAANPNLIYMQSTAMGESLYLAFFIWAVVYFAEFARQQDAAKSSRSLTKCGLCLAAACSTRYDGWFLAAVLVVAVVAVGLHRRNVQENKPDTFSPLPRMALMKFVLFAATAPLLWLAYNAAVYRNSLEFANGPYSAKAIERETATVNPAKGNMLVAGSYFVKAAELNVGESNSLGRLWLALALLGSFVVLFNGPGRIALLLWAPLPFYALSIAYGSVPIFVPTWWPFSQYNVRYGLQLLPALAVFVPLGIAFVIQRVVEFRRAEVSSDRWAPTATLLSVLVLSAASYALIWRAGPICYREAEINMRGRVALDNQLAGWIKSMPPDSTLLMYLGAHVGALEQAGVPLWRDINEGNHRVWKQPVDPDGLWERALADPAAYADYIIGFEGDPVWTAARNHGLTALVEIHTTGQPPAAIFLGRRQQHARSNAQYTDAVITRVNLNATGDREFR